jgi:hypothetical protein
MRQYLHHYEPAITASIQAAATQPRRTLSTFPGFVRSLFPRQRRAPKLYPTPTHQEQTSIGSRGVPTNRKHTRWKPSNTMVLQPITRFFSSKPD